MDANYTIVKAITGRWLAHNRCSLVERAFIAADLHAGVLQLIEPTQLQSAMLARVNACYAHWRESSPTGACSSLRALSRSSRRP
jgi:hypothetical protein